MFDVILQCLQNKKIIILGFGKEGVSTYRFYRKYFPFQHVTVADKSEHIKFVDIELDENTACIFGEHYVDNLNDYDLILKTPGISLKDIPYFVPREKISSQTDLFLQVFSSQTVGVTGTKGKSTTASLIYQILKSTKKDVLLCGNIGIPFFDIIDKIHENIIVVAELSAHQLEFLHQSPHIAILLNLYQEHLDHFVSFSDYQLAKLNITSCQRDNDYLIYNLDDFRIVELLQTHNFQRNYYPFRVDAMLEKGAYFCENMLFLMENKEKAGEMNLASLPQLPGKHNGNNVMAAVLACRLLNLKNEEIYAGLQQYKALPHRMEFVEERNGVKFYNDSISTIPEATIAALKTIKNVDTLLLGGFDRGIAYTDLIEFLSHSEVRNLVFMGPAGERILQEWKQSSFSFQKKYIIENEIDKIIKFVYENTKIAKTCLLSPAASSYDRYKNFEERGNVFKKAVLDS